MFEKTLHNKGVMRMVLKKQMRLVNWGTLVRIYDDTGVLLEELAERVESSSIYPELQDAFVKSIRLDKTDEGTSVMCMKIKRKVKAEGELR